MFLYKAHALTKTTKLYDRRDDDLTQGEITLSYEEFHVDAKQSIVFLHGANTGAWMWRPNIDYLNEYHCISVDLPGHGNSSDKEWETFEKTAQRVASLIKEKAKNGIADVVGLSLGGYIALTLLTIAPRTINRLVVSGVPSSKIPNAWFIRLVGYLLAPFLHNEKMIKANAKGLRIPEVYLHEYILNAKKITQKTFHRITKEAVSFQAPITIKNETHPKLFLAGEREHQLIKNSLSTYKTEYPNSESYLIKGLGHGWSLEDPELFSTMLRRWLKHESLPDGLQAIHGQH